MLNYIDAYVFMKDADGRYIYANSKVCEVLQYCPASDGMT